MSRILWIADGGCSTGFGRVTHAIGDRLVDRGHEVHCLAINFGGDYYPTKMRLYVPTLHQRDDTYGMSRIAELLQKIQPEAVILLQDTQVVARYLFENRWDPFKVLAQFRPIGYYPMDGHNRPKNWDSVYMATHPVAMSRFGQSWIPGSDLIYHGVDTNLFWPVSREQPITLPDGQVLKSKGDCKEAMGLPRGSFIVGRVDRNQGRKDYPALWKALQPVMKRHSDVVAYFHCKARGERSGVDIPALLSREPDTFGQFRLPNNFNPIHGYTQEHLNALYNAFDVFVSTSRGEGFGLTLAEAASCGVPVIAQNVAAIPEVVGPGGELIDPEREITVPFGQDQWLADIGAFSEAIEHAYQSSGWRRSKGKAGREHVTSSFSWDEAADKFHDYIGEVVAHGQDARGDSGSGGGDGASGD